MILANIQNAKKEPRKKSQQQVYEEVHATKKALARVNRQEKRKRRKKKQLNAKNKQNKQNKQKLQQKEGKKNSAANSAANCASMVTAEDQAQMELLKTSVVVVSSAVHVAAIEGWEPMQQQQEQQQLAKKEWKKIQENTKEKEIVDYMKQNASVYDNDFEQEEQKEKQEQEKQEKQAVAAVKERVQSGLIQPLQQQDDDQQMEEDPLNASFESFESLPPVRKVVNKIKTTKPTPTKRMLRQEEKNLLPRTPMHERETQPTLSKQMKKKNVTHRNNNNNKGKKKRTNPASTSIKKKKKIHFKKTNVPPILSIQVRTNEWSHNTFDHTVRPVPTIGKD